MSHLDKAKDLCKMMEQGKFLDAFEKYYHKDVVMVEASGESRKGKDKNRESQKDFMSRVRDFHGMGVTGITSNEKDGITMVESWMDITMTDGKRSKIEEVAVQKWQGDQIVHERFYYNEGKN